METFSANYGADRVRKATLQGRECLVAPVSLIVPGVLNGSRGPLYYPVDEIAKDPTIWNGVPIVVYHPQVEGQHVSARDPDILANQGIGQVLRAKFNGKKLVGEGWFDIEATRRVDNRIYQALMEGKPIELSTGLFTENEEMSGVYNGRPYTHIARNYKADHLAVFADMVGACSLRDGCGVLINSASSQEIPNWVQILNVGKTSGCGTGAGGFKAGNSCAKGGSASTPKTYEEAKAAVEIAKARFKKASVGGPGFDHDEFLNSRKDLETVRKQATQLKPKGKSSSSKTVKSSVEKVPASDIPVSFTAHDGGVKLSQKQATKLLKIEGIQPSIYGSGGPRGAAGVKTRHGHDETALMVTRSHAGKVRTSLEADGWKHTHTQNIDSISGGKNHQEVLKKGKYTATTVDYGYGDVTIQVSKSLKKPVINSASPQETPSWVKRIQANHQPTDNVWSAAARAAAAKARGSKRKIKSHVETLKKRGITLDPNKGFIKSKKKSKKEKPLERRTSLTEKRGNDWSGSAPKKSTGKKWSKKNTEGIKEALSKIKPTQTKSKPAKKTVKTALSKVKSKNPDAVARKAGFKDAADKKKFDSISKRQDRNESRGPSKKVIKEAKAAQNRIDSMRKTKESRQQNPEPDAKVSKDKSKSPRKGQGTGKFTKEQKAGMELAKKLNKQGAEAYARGKDGKKVQGDSLGTRLKKSAKQAGSNLIQKALSKIKSGAKKLKKRIIGNEEHEQVENVFSPEAREAARLAREQGKKRAAGKISKLRQQRMAERKAKPRSELARKGDVIRKKQTADKGMTLEERKSRAAEANKRTLERYGRRPMATNSVWSNFVVNSQGQTMKLKPEAKTRIVNDLIANTGVGVVGPWMESDRVALVELPDEKLKHMDNVRKETAAKVTANKAVPTSTGAPNNGETKDVEVTIEGKQYALNAATGNYELKKTPTGNCGGHQQPVNDKPMTEEEWMKKAPSRVRAAVSNAMRLEDEEKERLIAHIVSNVSDEEARKKRAESYMTKTLEELQDMYDLVPQKAVTGNTEVARPRYFGPGANPVTPPKPVFNAQDMIPEQEIDWNEVSESHNRQRQTA